jgi:MYXO-CTERM domain-containing protein
MAKTSLIIKAKAKVYRYALYVYELDGLSASGLGELPGNDFIVSVGYAGTNNNQVVQSSTFMHELGHNLKLGHGGGDHENNKANFLSVMNYYYQFPFGYAGRPLDFSRFALASLDERNLDETVGIQGPASWKQVIFSHGGNDIVTNTDASQGLDFDQSGAFSKPVVSDTNKDGNTSVLKSQHDWDNILIAFQDLPNPNKAFGDELPYNPEDEPSVEDALELGRKSDSDQDGLNNTDDNCPTVVNAGQEDADEDGVGDACDACPEIAAPGYEDGCPEADAYVPADGPGSGDSTEDPADEDFQPTYVGNEGGCSSASNTASQGWFALMILGFLGLRRRKS